jgi:hypothetical protein
MYDALTPFNISLRHLRESTASSINLSDSAHRASLLNWLNDWGCRHLSKESHHIASSAILDWHNQEGVKLFSADKPLWELSDREITIVSNAYGALKARIGACPTRGDQELQISIGPTAASKILFAIRPAALMPWDEAMRKEFGCDGSSESYFKFLVEIKELADKIRELCKTNGFNILELPHKINRDSSTVLELINEYIWVTVTRKCMLPSIQNLILWVNWKLLSNK